MKNKDVVICSINSKYIHSSLAPWCLYAGVKEYCNCQINAKVVEGTINENIKDIEKRILELNPNVISFCCYIWNINEVFELVERIKEKCSNTTIILGGPEVSYCATKVLTNHKSVDFIVSGEGEKAFAYLLNALSLNEDTSNLDGVCYRKNGEIIESAPAILTDDPVSPYCEEYFENLGGRIAYLETSRGCPYSCAFCLSGRCGKARFFDIERAKSDITKLANSGAKTIKLVDRTFNANKKRAKELFLFIIENYKKTIPDGVCFHFEIAGDILDDETINILKSAPVGLMQLEIGMQSFNAKALEYINRKTDVDKLQKNILKLVENQNMHIHIDLIAGLPYEDYNSFKNSFNIGFSLKSNMLQLGFLKLLYGAPMRDEPNKFPCSYSETPPYEVISTPWLNEMELNKLHLIEDALDRIHNSGRFRQTLEYTLDSSALSPFDLFEKFALSIQKEEINNITLDKYTELLYAFLKTLNGIDEKILRDKMICDRLATNASGKIPKFLQIEDKMLKKYKNALNENKLTKKAENIIRAVAILYSQRQIVYVDYCKSNKTSNEYKLNLINIDNIKLQ